MQFAKGMRDKLEKYLNVNNKIEVIMEMSGKAIYDFCCFGIDQEGKLSDERYMIFYNQVKSPNNEITFSSEENRGKFIVDLEKLPLNIQKLVFTVSIDGNGVMSEIISHKVMILQENSECIAMSLGGSDFSAEKAIISVELYRKDVWRLAAVGNGFNGGLSALLAYFVGEEEVQKKEKRSTVQLRKNEEELAQEVMGKISLSKDKVNLEKHVVNLSKCVVDLSKKSGVDLGATSAKVVVVLDYSGSMSNLYQNGTVQRTINRLVPLGLTFDDNGSIDVYLFQNDFRKMQDLNLSNYENYVKNIVFASGYQMGGTNYAPVLKAIIEGGSYKQGGFLGFGGTTVVTEAIVDNGDPTFILFITDGANADRNETDNIIRKSSEMNVFIQFIGIGNEKFEYLMKLDDMPGRKRDNTGFSKMQALDHVNDNELYTNVLEQFSGWLRGLQ